MTLEVRQQHKETVTFGPAENIKSVYPPLNFTPEKTLVFVAVSNLPNESTFGASMGNVLVTPIAHPTGSFVNLIRDFNYQQSIIVTVDIFEYTAASSISIERKDLILNNPSQKTTALLSNGWGPKTLAIANIRGAASWNSDMAEFTVLPQEDPDTPGYLAVFHKKVDPALNCHVQVVTLSDQDNELQKTVDLATFTAGQYTQTLTNNVVKSRAMNFVSLFGSTYGIKDGRDFPVANMISDNQILWEMRNNTVSKTWYLQTYTLKLSNQSKVYRDANLVTSPTTRITLPEAVEISESLALVTGQYSSWGAATTYEEESGDFSFRLQLIDRGDGFADEMDIIRGQSASNPTSYCCWEVSTYGELQNQKTDYYYRRAKLRKVS